MRAARAPGTSVTSESPTNRMLRAARFRSCRWAMRKAAGSACRTDLAAFLAEQLGEHARAVYRAAARNHHAVRVGAEERQVGGAAQGREALFQFFLGKAADADDQRSLGDVVDALADFRRPALLGQADAGQVDAATPVFGGLQQGVDGQLAGGGDAGEPVALDAQALEPGAFHHCWTSC